jgi:hypothetical protein
MVQKKKISLGDGGGGASTATGPLAFGVTGRARTSVASVPEPTREVLELYFRTGTVFHDLDLGLLPDTVSGFVRRPAPGVLGAPAAGGGAEVWSVARAPQGEEPEVEISALEAAEELSRRWIPVPYQLSAPHVVQLFLSPTEDGSYRAVLAIDTREAPATAGMSGRLLDAALDEGRPFRPLERDECASFLDHPLTREWLRRLEKKGIERAPFKLAALYEVLGPRLPRLKLARIDPATVTPVSLVVDLGNSRSTALLVEASRGGSVAAPGEARGLSAVPLSLRRGGDPTQTSDEPFDARLTFLPGPFDRSSFDTCVGDAFAWPSIARLGREAMDRALDTPHRYLCTLSGPKRYLWDDRPTRDPWTFAASGMIAAIDAGSASGSEPQTIHGRILKYLVDDAGGLVLRGDGPSTPADPRYAPRTTMLFAFVEILSQALAQIQSPSYRQFQGREAAARVLRHVCVTYPSGMTGEEREVYETLIRNAVILSCWMLGIPEDARPNFDPATKTFTPFLFIDEAMAAQMVYVFEEVAGTFSGNMEELLAVYGRSDDGRNGPGGGAGPAGNVKASSSLRIASVDIGGGTTDVMIAEYRDRQPGAGTSLSVTTLFQDGVSIAGDEVCRGLLEEVVFPQITAQLPTPAARRRWMHLFGDGDAGHGAAWRTLRAKLVPYVWMPLARTFWAIAEGREPEGHSAEKTYTLGDLERTSSVTWSSSVLEEVDRFLATEIPGFPGLPNLFFRYDRAEIDRAIESVLREPLRRYSDILAQFDVDLLVLAGRTSALACVRRMFEREMPVAPARIQSMSKYRVGDWYPSKWREEGAIGDPKTTVAAGATVLHLAGKNLLPGFFLDSVERASAPAGPIFGVWQDSEPHLPRPCELFPASADGRVTDVSAPFLYAAGMIIGWRNVASPEMDGSPLFEVRATSPEVEAALLEDRVHLRFARSKSGGLSIKEVTSQRDVYSFAVSDFALRLKTLTGERYWLDTGIFPGVTRSA